VASGGVEGFIRGICRGLSGANWLNYCDPRLRRRENL